MKGKRFCHCDNPDIEKSKKQIENDFKIMAKSLKRISLENRERFNSLFAKS